MKNKFIEADAIVMLLEIVQGAIKRGDWKVDGACDPDMAIEYAKLTLRQNGYTENSLDDSFFLDLA